MTVPPPLPAPVMREPSRGKRVSCVVAIVLVFLFIGPPVGALAFMLTTALIGMGAKVDLAGLSWIGLFALIYAAPLSYLIGAGPAAIGGLVVGIRQAFFGPVTWPMALLTGAGLGAGFLLLSGQSLASVVSNSEQRDYLVIMVVTCLAATMVCWGIVRNWHFGPRGRAEAIA